MSYAGQTHFNLMRTVLKNTKLTCSKHVSHDVYSSRMVLLDQVAFIAAEVEVLDANDSLHMYGALVPGVDLTPLRFD